MVIWSTSSTSFTVILISVRIILEIQISLKNMKAFATFQKFKRTTVVGLHYHFKLLLNQNLFHKQMVVAKCMCHLLSHVQLFATPWTVARQAPLSMGFSRQKHWSGLPFPSPGDLSDLGIEAVSPALAGRFFTNEPPGKPLEK